MIVLCFLAALQSAPLFMLVGREAVTDERKTWILTRTIPDKLPKEVTLYRFGDDIVIEEGDPFGLKRIEAASLVLKAFMNKSTTKLKDAPAPLKEILSQHLSSRSYNLDNPENLTFRLTPSKKITFEKDGRTVSFVVQTQSNDAKFPEDKELPTDSLHGKPSASIESPLPVSRPNVQFFFGNKGLPDERSRLMKKYIENIDQTTNSLTADWKLLLSQWHTALGVAAIEKGQGLPQMDPKYQKEIEMQTKAYSRFGFKSENEMIAFMSGAKVNGVTDYVALEFKFRRKGEIPMVDSFLFRP